MGAVSPVGAYGPTNCTTMQGSAYKNQLDSNSVAAQRIVTRFAPHAAASPNMTVLVDPGSIFDGTTLTEMPQQTTATIAAPVNYKRIDRIVLDNVTGSILVVGGQEATNAVPPAIPNGKSPVAQVALAVGVTAITNAIITDERNFGSLAPASFGAQASIGSAATCDLGTVLSRNALITGVTPITSFGASANTQSPIYLVEFAAALTLKNGAALLLPGGADIVTAAGDTAMTEYLGGGSWRVRTYQRADGSSIDAFTPDNGTSPGTQGLVPAPPVGAAAAHAVLTPTGWAANNQTGFTSSAQSITSGGLLTIAHGLGVTPMLFSTFLQNVTAEGGFQPTDAPVLVGPNQDMGGSNVSRGHSLWADATNIYVRFGAQANTSYDLLNKTTGAAFDATNSKWSFIVNARS